MRKLTIAALAATSMLALAGCQDDAQIASYNISKAANNLKLLT